MVLTAGDDLAQALRRVQSFLPGGDFGQLGKWTGSLRISWGRSPLACRHDIDALAGLLRWLEGQGLGLGQRLGDVTADTFDRWHQWHYLECGIGTSTWSGDLSATRQFFAWRERMSGAPSLIRDFPGPARSHREPSRFTTGQLKRLLGGLRPLYGDRSARLSDSDAIDVADRDGVFLTLSNRPTGRRMGCRALNGVLTRLIKRSRLNIAPGMALHTLRSTYATALCDHKFNLEEIRILLGHQSIITTRRYIALSIRQLKVRLPLAYFSKIIDGRPLAGPQAWGASHVFR